MFGLKRQNMRIKNLKKNRYRRIHFKCSSTDEKPELKSFIQVLPLCICVWSTGLACTSVLIFGKREFVFFADNEGVSASLFHILSECTCTYRCLKLILRFNSGKFSIIYLKLAFSLCFCFSFAVKLPSPTASWISLQDTTLICLGHCKLLFSVLSVSCT